MHCVMQRLATPQQGKVFYIQYKDGKKQVTVPPLDPLAALLDHGWRQFYDKKSPHPNNTVGRTQSAVLTLVLGRYQSRLPHTNGSNRLLALWMSADFG